MFIMRNQFSDTQFVMELIVIRNLSTSSLLLLLLFCLVLSSCKNTNYEPYNTENEEEEPVPPANYEGRMPTRFLSKTQYDVPQEINLAPGRSLQVSDSKPESSVGMNNPSGEADYELGPGDVLEVIYQLKNIERAESYRLNVQDEIEVSFFYTPEYNRQLVVGTDGKVSFPLIEDFSVVGSSVAEIEKELSKRYSKFLKDPVIELKIQDSNIAIRELKRAITTAPRGQSRLEPIRPDGYISLPLIGDVLAAGKTVPQLSEAIINKYHSQNMVDIDVTVVLLEVKSPIVYILGEVLNPGAHVLNGPVDIWRSIGLAGGFNNSADQDHVMLARASATGEQRYVFSFQKWQGSMDAEQNALIKRGDLIFVPKAQDMSIYVMGELDQPTRIPINYDTKLYASQAIAYGGRVLSSGNRRQVLVLRRSLNKEPVVIEVDLQALLDPTNYDEPDDYIPRDVLLQPGDIVYVPNSTIGSIDRFAEAWFRNGLWTIVPFHVVYSLNN